jgi:isoquinoline 1-oxidoreductase beta subunit
VQNPGKVIHNVGDAEAQLSGAGKKVEAGYELPFLANATMEPMNCTADIREDRAEVWAPTQGPEWIQGMVAQIAKLPRESVAVHTTLMGGAFGRRYQSDFGVEAAQVSKAVGKPVQVLWTREDDMQHDFYRQAFHHRLSAALDQHGNISAWRHRVASTSIRAFWDPPEKAKPEAQEIGGAAFIPYAIPNFRIEYAPVATEVPRAWWRSVEDSSSGFVVESFLDELAAAAGVDPLEFRLRFLKEDRKVPNVMWPTGAPLDTRRFRNTLQLASDKAGWGKPLPAGQARGIACWYSFDTFVSEAAEVSVEKNGRVRVHRVVCAVDCGRAVHPDGVASQMEGAIIYGLSAALMGEITVEGGAVKQSNFNDYPVLRMREAPKIEVHIVPSQELPTGTGEPGLPPAAPAVANAIFAATGKRIRRLPIRAEDLRSA